MKTWIARGKPTRFRDNCPLVLRVLQSYLDDALDDQTAGYVARHLEDCQDCVLKAETYRQIKNSLARRGQGEPAPVRRLGEFAQTLLSVDEADESSPKEGSFGGGGSPTAS